MKLTHGSLGYSRISAEVKVKEGGEKLARRAGETPTHTRTHMQKRERTHIFLTYCLSRQGDEVGGREGKKMGAGGKEKECRPVWMGVLTKGESLVNKAQTICPFVPVIALDVAA